MDVRSLTFKILRGFLIYLGACLLFFGVWAVWGFIEEPLPTFTLFGVPTVPEPLLAGAAVALVFGLVKSPRFGLWLNNGVTLTFALTVTIIVMAGNHLFAPIDPVPVLLTGLWSPFIGGVAGTLAAALIKLIRWLAAGKKTADKG